MELTAWQKFCNRILGRILKKRARKDVALSENLVKGSMGIMPEVYLSTVIFTSIAIALVCWGIIGIFFLPELGVIAFWESLQDPATINPCLDWEYWEPELVDKSKPGNGCPEYMKKVPKQAFALAGTVGKGETVNVKNKNKHFCIYAR
ncbi:MAG: hypothetical protein VXW28_00885, partial [Candidatus Thermoplasmatota archaeon]|nr:hypothetical protein [Candidatus Thermoplasmatota archaeon]